MRTFIRIFSMSFEIMFLISMTDLHCMKPLNEIIWDFAVRLQDVRPQTACDANSDCTMFAHVLVSRRGADRRERESQGTSGVLKLQNVEAKQTVYELTAHCALRGSLREGISQAMDDRTEWTIVTPLPSARPQGGAQDGDGPLSSRLE